MGWLLLKKKSYEVWMYFCGGSHFLDVFIVILLICLIWMFITVTNLVTSFDLTVSHWRVFQTNTKDYMASVIHVICFMKDRTVTGTNYINPTLCILYHHITSKLLRLWYDGCRWVDGVADNSPYSFSFLTSYALEVNGLK